MLLLLSRIDSMSSLFAYGVWRTRTGPGLGCAGLWISTLSSCVPILLRPYLSATYIMIRLSLDLSSYIHFPPSPTSPTTFSLSLPARVPGHAPRAPSVLLLTTYNPAHAYPYTYA